MVNLALMKELNVSFIEAGLLERIRYFSEFDENGSGWCYVGKLRLADEFGMSKVGLLKAIQRLIDRNLLIKNGQGWLMVNSEGLTKFTGQQSLPVNKVDDRGKLSLPNNILKDNIDNSNSSSLVLLGKQSLLPAEQSLPVNKVPAVRKKGKTYLDDASFDQLMQMQDKQQSKIGYGLVYLKMSDYEKFVQEFGKEMTHEMILQLDIYKGDNKVFSGKQRYVADERAMRQSWVINNARTALQAKNSNIVHELKKTEKAQDKIKKLWLDQ